MSQDGQTFLKRVWPFWDIIHCKFYFIQGLLETQLLLSQKNIATAVTLAHKILDIFLLKITFLAVYSGDYWRISLLTLSKIKQIN